MSSDTSLTDWMWCYENPKEAAVVIVDLERRLAEAQERERGAIGYLTRNVLEPHNARPLPDLMGICTQIDNIVAGLKRGNL